MLLVGLEVCGGREAVGRCWPIGYRRPVDPRRRGSCNAMVDQACRLLRRRRTGRLAVGLGTHVLGGADASANSIDIADGGQLVAVCSAATAGRPSRPTGGLGPVPPPAGADGATACRGRVVGARRT